jgi:peptide/nickel transport system permease protein
MAEKRKKQSYWRLVGRQFSNRRPALVALALLGVLVIVALGAPFLANDRPVYCVKDGKHYWFPNVLEYRDLAYVDFSKWQRGPGDYGYWPPVPYSPERSDLLNRLQGPNRYHWLGSDDRGRDVLSRMIWGTRISISIGFVAVGIAVLIGVIAGALGGYYGGWIDWSLQRVIEIMMCIPVFFLIISLIAFLPQSIYNVMVVIGITGWTGVARLVRGEFFKLRDSDFATAARATGLSDRRVIFRHILPNALAPVLVSATFGVAGAILTESALSFLGFGVPPPTASWGEILSQSKRYIDTAWWLVTFPGAAIFITVTAFNLVGEGLRDAMDPRMRQ